MYVLFLGFSPDFSSAQVVPGSVVFGNALYLGICVARILPEMVPPGLTFGEHFVEIEPAHGHRIHLFLYVFSQIRQNVHEKSGLACHRLNWGV